MSQRPDRDKFQATHNAWREATSAYEGKMQAMLYGGRPFDGVEMLAECAELERLLHAFTESSKPFVACR